MTTGPGAAASVDSLYLPHQKIYPREVDGVFARARTATAWALLGAFYGLPWLRWNGRQAILFDLPARKFHIFGLTLWPQDFLYLSALLILGAISLFFFTALAGRLWCGYACPQTVWTEVYLWMERLTEGNRTQRLRLDRAGWSLNKFARKASKQVLWIAFGIYTGYSFVGYFTPITQLGAEFIEGTAGRWETFWVLFYGFATYGNAGFLREQVCKYMCPYARFQAAMFDRDTLVISYDQARGEPRGARSRNAHPRQASLGDCVDCTICVQVCPTGIDIRNGLQYECIACAACIDACDDVMARVGYEPGLIRYTTENAMHGAKTRVIRPRVIVYASILTIVLGALLTSLAVRRPIGLDVIRDRNALYREVSGGLIENVYSLRVMNKDDESHRYRLSVQPADTFTIDGPAFVDVSAGSVYALATRVRTRGAGLPAKATDIVLTVTAADRTDLTASSRTRFFSPGSSK
jgi:cytochrome c oxidase accessory protein FixG